MFESLFAKGGLSLERLQTFCAVAEAGGIAKAAPDDLGRQSQYSRQIRQLEEFFGRELTRRNGREVILTTDGEKLAALSREVLGSLSEFLEEGRGDEPEINFGAGESLLRYEVMPRLERMAKTRTSTRVRMLNLRTQAVVEGLLEGTLDLGLIREDSIPTGLEGEEVLASAYVVILPKLLRTKGKALEGWDRLKGVPWVGLEGEGKLATDIQALAAKRKVELQTVLRCPSLALVAAAVSGGSGAGLLPRAAARDFPADRFEHLDLPGMDKLIRRIALVWNPRRMAVRGRLEKARRQWLGAFSHEK